MVKKTDDNSSGISDSERENRMAVLASTVQGMKADAKKNQETQKELPRESVDLQEIRKTEDDYGGLKYRIGVLERGIKEKERGIEKEKEGSQEG